MPRKQNKNKKQKHAISDSKKNKGIESISENGLPINDLEFISSSCDDDFRCRDISPEHCEELRNRKFTNKKEDLFLEVRSLEERYKYRIEEEKKKCDHNLLEIRKKNANMYKTALHNKEKELRYEIAELKAEMEENIHTLETQEHMVLSQIDMVYKINKDRIIEDFLEIIGLHF